MKGIRNILFIIGTRPEAIKLAPLIIAAQQEADLNVKVCLSAQHRGLLDEVIDFFDIKADYDLNLMEENQDTLTFLSRALAALSPVLDEASPDCVFVQGDTSTVLASSLAAFHKKIVVAHLEAGLRSYDKMAPFPEEMNRILCSNLATLHFAPTEIAANNLKKENIQEQVFTVGNTVVDAVELVSSTLEKKGISYGEEFPQIDFSKKIILLSCHRRESFGKPLEDICRAVNQLVEEREDIQILWLKHPNPNVRETVERLLKGSRVVQLEAVAYPQLIWLLKASYFVLTDSGGIQEEAPSFAKPVLILREVTERLEGIENGIAQLVGSNPKLILDYSKRLLDEQELYLKMSAKENPYGNGKSSNRILEILKSV